MGWGACDGCPFLTPDLASFALAMVTLNTEDDCGIYAFASSLTPVTKIHKDMTINQALASVQSVC